MVKFEVVAFIRAKLAAAVVANVPVAVTDEADVVNAVAVVPYAEAEVAW